MNKTIMSQNIEVTFEDAAWNGGFSAITVGGCLLKKLLVQATGISAIEYLEPTL